MRVEQIPILIGEKRFDKLAVDRCRKELVRKSCDQGIHYSPKTTETLPFDFDQGKLPQGDKSGGCLNYQKSIILLDAVWERGYTPSSSLI